MSRNIFLLASLVCAVLVFGCSKTETTNNSNAPAGSADKPATSTSSSGTASSGTASTSDDKIGVPECDDFIAKYDACVSAKVPEMVRAQYKEAISRWRSEWKKLAADASARPQLVAACKQAAEQQAAALKSFGCNF